MSGLRQALAGYLTVRRALGYKLVQHENVLGQFVTYLEDAGAATVTTAHALAWAAQPGGAASWHADRLSMARGFACWLQATGTAAEVPPAGMFPAGQRRATPYLYSAADISALITAAGMLPSPLRAAVYQTLIGLLAVTGMRISEAIGLDDGDIDSGAGVLTVREAKFGKSRQIPLHPTAAGALRRYLQRRGHLQPVRHHPAVFISTTGTRLVYCTIHQTWKQLTSQAGLRPRSASCRPRIHDLRHSFAVATVLDSYRAGGDPQARLALLATYLGHADPKHTYWYLSELSGIASDGRCLPGSAAMRAA